MVAYTYLCKSIEKIFLSFDSRGFVIKPMNYFTISVLFLNYFAPPPLYLLPPRKKNRETWLRKIFFFSFAFQFFVDRKFQKKTMLPKHFLSLVWEPFRIKISKKLEIVFL